MPGIAGLISRKPPDECRRVVERMVRSMLHERFYRCGSYSLPGLGFYAGRVAHAGSFADCPIVGESGEIALVFSGECFWDRQGRVGSTQSDHACEQRADRLIHLYEERGDKFFSDLNGLFSGFLIDQRRQKALLFNDRYGMERLYCHERPDGLVFASEAKALLQVLPELRRFDNRGVAQMLAFGCTLDWRTLFRDISLLPGGSVWSFENGTSRKARYFVPAHWESAPSLPAEAYRVHLGETMRRIVPRYFSGNSGVGVSLTGGLDTRMIMACRPRDVVSPPCYTFSGEDGDTLDVRLASLVASAEDLPHRVLRIGRDFFSDFESIADRTVYVTDGCLGITGAHELYLNRRARDLAPVRLTGNFGSEILRGVTTFKPLGLSPDLVEPDVARGIAEERARVAEVNAHPVSSAAFREIPWSLFGVWRAAQSQLVTRTPYLDNDLVALAFQVPRALRRSGGPGLRLLREIGGGLDRIPTDRGWVPARPGPIASARSLWYPISFKLEYWCNDGLPHWLSAIDSPVSRFGQRLGLVGVHKYLHYRQWFREELAGYLRERLAGARDRAAAFWNPRALARLVNRHLAGHHGNVAEIDTVLTLSAIHRLLLADPGGGSGD